MENSDARFHEMFRAWLKDVFGPDFDPMDVDEASYYELEDIYRDTM